MENSVYISRNQNSSAWVFLGTFGLLAVFWLAIWILDFMYYNRLLIGAVDALLEIEKQTPAGNRVGELMLSTRIEAAVAGEKKPDGARLRNEWGRWFFYGLVFLALLAGLSISVWAGGGLTALFPPR